MLQKLADSGEKVNLGNLAAQLGGGVGFEKANLSVLGAGLWVGIGVIGAAKAHPEYCRLPIR